MSRAGLNRKTAYATLAMTLAAEAPDLDMFWGLRGPVAAIEHHRGITHSLVGAPFMALLVTGFVWLWHRMYGHRKQHNDPPILWGWIWLFALLADLSHILLDWTNNYGVRPFFPFNAHWYAGSFVFILDPILLGLLLLALVVPALLGLADREIGLRRPRFRGQGWAIFALSGVLLLWSWRWAEHRVAITTIANQPITQEAATRIFASPHPVSPWLWDVVAETRDYYQLAQLNLRTGAIRTHAPEDIFYKQPVTPAIHAAEGSWLGRVYLDWSQFPLVDEGGVVGPAGAPYTQVRFRDMRFFSTLPMLPMGHKRRHAPLSGVVTVAPDGQIDSMVLDGREQQ
jgi:inner membrane protein